MGTLILLEKAMATHSSTLAWRIAGTAEPGGLPSMGSHGVGHDWSDLAAAAANTLVVSQVVLVVKNLLANTGDLRDTSSIPGLGGSPGDGHGNHSSILALKNPRDRGAWGGRGAWGWCYSP